MAAFLALILAFQASGDVDNVVRGRLVFADGRPASDVEVQARIAPHDAYTAWDNWYDAPRKTHVVRTSLDGRFELCVGKDSRVERVFVHEPGFARAQWQTFSPQPQAIELGEHVLEPGASVRGVIGGIKFVPFDLQLQLNVATHPSQRSSVHVNIGVDPWTGEFEARDLPRGIGSLDSSSEPWLLKRTPFVLLPGRQTELDDSVMWNNVDVHSTNFALEFTRPSASMTFPQSWNFADFVIRGGTIFESRSPSCGSEHFCGSMNFGFSTFTPAFGDWTLELLDPRFEPIETTYRVPSTQRPTICLTGSSSLQILVRDADTGSEVRDAQIRLVRDRLPFPEFGGASLFEPGDSWPSGGVFGDVVPGDWKLKVTRDGYAPAWAPVLELAPRERRWVAVDLARTGQLRGVVDTPCDVAFTEMRAYLLQPGYEQVVEGQWSRTNLLNFNRDSGGRRVQVARIETDGTFRFDEVTPGTCSLKVIGSPSFVSPIVDVVLGAGEMRGDVVVPMPAVASLTGQVDGLLGVQACALRLLHQGHSLPGSREVLARDGQRGTDFAPLRPDGTFEVGPVSDGDYDVILELSHATPSSSAGGSPMSARIGNVRLELGRGSANFTAPLGRLNLRFASDEPLPAGCTLRAIRNSNQKPPPPYPSGFALSVPDDGSLLSTAVFSANWILDVQGPQSAWFVQIDEPVEVRVGETTERTIHVPLQRGRLRLIDAASDEPLGLFEVHVGAARGRELKGGANFVTDARGELELVLPRGDGYVSLGLSGPARFFTWPPARGEVPTIALAP